MFASNIPVAHAYWREDWEEDVTQKSFVPVFVIYDPPGADSYQRITTGLSMSLKLSFKSEAGCIITVKSGLSTTLSVTLQQGWTTSTSSDPTYVGAGGDGIFGKKMNFTWHVWGYTLILPRGEIYTKITKAELRGLKDDGIAFVARADLPNFAYKVDSVPNLRGTVGEWHYPETGTISLGPTLTFEQMMEHSWSATSTIDVGAKISIEILSAKASFGVSWSSSVTGTLSYKTYVFVRDSTNWLEFTINAKSGSWGSAPKIQDYIFWFNEY